MKATIYDTKAKEAKTLELPENLFGLPWNADLVHQVVTSLQSSQRKPYAHTKTRGEVRGGGRKPWRQKGTGRARHGSTRSPIWVGGGVTHGPRNDKNYERKVSKKMRAKAFYTILSKKYKDGEILFVDSLKFSAPKTKEAALVLRKLSQVKGFEKLLSKNKNSAVVALSEKNAETERAVRNLPNMEISEVRNLNPLSLLSYKFLILENPESSLNNLPGQKLFNSESTPKTIKKAPAKKAKAKVKAR